MSMLSCVQLLRAAIRKYFPKANGKLCKAVACMFTNTSDKRFIVDFHPQHPQASLYNQHSDIRCLPSSPSLGACPQFILEAAVRVLQVVLCSACSGHGFKFCSVMGEILADLVLKGTTHSNIDLHRISNLREATREIVGRSRF